mmetsp:Transcript_4990/g.8853  ORF Transcript_4990/g.8853 Transcript_4990/m.8853 type:complete len:118 (-) Transcript_4990:59-412(-)
MSAHQSLLIRQIQIRKCSMLKKKAAPGNCITTIIVETKITDGTARRVRMGTATTTTTITTTKQMSITGVTAKIRAEGSTTIITLMPPAITSTTAHRQSAQGAAFLLTDQTLLQPGAR